MNGESAHFPGTPDDEHALLCQLAYQAWIDRGQPLGSPEVDWAVAVQQRLGMHPAGAAPAAPASRTAPTSAARRARALRRAEAQ